MLRPPTQRLPITLAVLVFVPISCFESECGPDALECIDDRGCPAESVCREETDGCGDSSRQCVGVTECTSDADCPAGEPCVRRDGATAGHPFERSVEEGGVCGCGEDENCVPFVGTTVTTAAGTGGTGGDGSGGFSPATSVTVGPTSSQTGSGGATSSSSSGQGGSGQGGGTATTTSSGGGAGGGSSSSAGGGGGGTSSSGTGGAGGGT